ncbi:MAG: DNA-processing protein DprA [Cyanobacteriota bacterium]|nr:DNA-processing protein DprA [Cyanobacteriota bacterium]
MGELVPVCFGGSAAARGFIARREQRLWWLLWSRCPGVAGGRLRTLEQCFPRLEMAWRAPVEQLQQLPGFGPATVAAIDRYRQRWGVAPLAAVVAAWQGGRRVLLPGDGRWPQALAQLQRPPVALAWEGRGSLWPLLAQGRAVAVVGTRRPSPHGLLMARRIGESLARAGWPVVSGLAEGIDAAAHRGCLAAGGATVAVLGTPLERVYPRHHGPLQRQIARRGLLVSEQPPGAVVQAGQFAARNRLQVALACAVVVVECPLSSGALHSARLAEQLQLPLWVVPADAARLSALGSNQLLARGAAALLQPSDLAAALPQPPPLTPRPCAAVEAAVDPAQRALLQAVGSGAHLSELAQCLRQPPERLASLLLELELAGLLRAEPGLFWRPA